MTSRAFGSLFALAPRQYILISLVSAVWGAVTTLVGRKDALGVQLVRRKEPHIDVSNWYYMTFILVVAILHIVNNLAIPVSLGQELLGLLRRAGRRDGATAISNAEQGQP